MEFAESKAIYLQIAEYIEEKILAGDWPADERIPSVRDLAASIGVNYNTVVRTYEFLQQQEVIFNRRGLGYFVGLEAQEHVRQSQRQEFVNKMLPELFRKMDLLGFSLEEISEHYKNK
jgi:Predicted transcriptional regulators